MPRESPAISEPIIRIENVTRTFSLGDVEVQALRGRQSHRRARRIRRHHGFVGFGQVDADERSSAASTGRRAAIISSRASTSRRLREPDLARIRSERLGFVFQSFNLLARTSAIENVGAAALSMRRRAGQPRGAQSSARMRRCEFVGLGDRERNTPGQLSGGQQQRVAIARALINAPSLLLADEPTGNLDTRTSHEIMETLVTLNREQGVTIVVVTHEPDIAAYADRIVTMRDGEIVSDERVNKPAVPEAGAGSEHATVSARPSERRLACVRPAAFSLSG